MSSLREKAYERIRKLISHGELLTGERLVENKISEMINVGRTPIREAIRRLEAEGYVEILANRGAVVKKLSLQELREIYDLIALLEGYAIEIATQKIKTHNKRELQAIQRMLIKVAKARDYRSWMEKNAQFHSYFSKLSGNLTLHNSISQLRRRSSRYRFMAFSVPGSLEEYVRDHDKILKNVFNGESQEAGKMMREHILNAREKLFEFLKQSAES